MWKCGAHAPNNCRAKKFEYEMEAQRVCKNNRLEIYNYRRTWSASFVPMETKRIFHCRWTRKILFLWKQSFCFEDGWQVKSPAVRRLTMEFFTNESFPTLLPPPPLRHVACEVQYRKNKLATDMWTSAGLSPSLRTFWEFLQITLPNISARSNELIPQI